MFLAFQSGLGNFHSSSYYKNYVLVSNPREIDGKGEP